MFLCIRTHHNGPQKVIVILQLLNIINESDKGHISLIFYWEFLLKREGFQLKLTNWLLLGAMSVLFKTMVLTSHWLIDVIDWHEVFVVMLTLLCTMRFHGLFVCLLVCNVLEFQGWKKLEIRFLYLVDYLFQLLFQCLFAEFLVWFCQGLLFSFHF